MIAVVEGVMPADVTCLRLRPAAAVAVAAELLRGVVVVVVVVVGQLLQPGP